MPCVLGGHFNLHRGLAGTTSLGCYLHKLFKGDHRLYDSFIIGLQEPAVAKGNRVIGLDSSFHLRYDKTATRVRAALCASPQLDLWTVAQYTNGDMATGLRKSMEPSVPEVYVVSVYCEITSPQVCPAKLTNLLRVADRRDTPVLLLMDANCPQHAVGVQ